MFRIKHIYQEEAAPAEAPAAAPAEAAPAAAPTLLSGATEAPAPADGWFAGFDGDENLSAYQAIGEKYGNNPGELAKAYHNITKQLGGMTGAPEAYELANVNMDNPLVGSVLGWAKEAGVSQESIGGLVEGVNQVVEAQFNQVAEQVAEQMRTIPNFQGRQQALVTSLKSSLQPDQIDAIMGMDITTKAQFEALEGLVKGQMPTQPHTEHSEPLTDGKVLAAEELQGLYAERRQYSNPQDARFKAIQDKIKGHFEAGGNGL